MAMERFKELIQRPRLVAHGHQNGRLVVTAGRHLLAPNDQESGGIVRSILDAVCQLLQTIELGRHISGNGCCSRLLGGTPGGLRITGNGNPLNTVAMGIQPLPALGNGLLMGLNPGAFLVAVLRRPQ